MNFVCSNLMTAESLKVDARSSTPLFQTQPSGCPSMAQIKMGFRSFAAVACASSSEVFHGIDRQASSVGGRSSLCSFSNSLTDNPPMAEVARAMLRRSGLIIEREIISNRARHEQQKENQSRKAGRFQSSGDAALSKAMGRRILASQRSGPMYSRAITTLSMNAC